MNLKLVLALAVVALCAVSVHGTTMAPQEAATEAAGATEAANAAATAAPASSEDDNDVHYGQMIFREKQMRHHCHTVQCRDKHTANIRALRKMRREQLAAAMSG